MMPSPAVLIPQPDLEKWVWDNIGHLKGVTSFAYSALQDYPGWQYVYGVQVDCRARRKQAARDLSHAVLRILMALTWLPWPEGQITYMQPTEGPFWNPDPEDGMPRYTARYEIRVHPSRATAPEPPWAGPPDGTEQSQPA